MTREEFLIDTIQYYSANPLERRCVDDYMLCTYTPNKPTTQGCAIGRFMTPEQQSLADKIIFLNEFFNNDNIMPAILKPLGLTFLHNVQRLHDKYEYWNNYGLTESGIREVNKIITTDNLDMPKLISNAKI